MSNHIISQYYQQDILTRLAYHSTSLIDNPITFSEVSSIINDNYISMETHGFSIIHFYQVENHKQAFFYLMKLLSNNQSLTSSELIKLHQLIFDRIPLEKQILIHKYSEKDWQQCLLHIEHLSQDTTFSKDNTPYFSKYLAQFYLQFIQQFELIKEELLFLHLLMIYISLKYHLPPIIIKVDDRMLYEQAIKQKDINTLAMLFAKILDKEWRRFSIFHK